MRILRLFREACCHLRCCSLRKQRSRRLSLLVMKGFLVYILIFNQMLWADSLPPASAIASAHPLATAAGEKIIHEGGNAFDAAVAVSAVLAVVEPYACGLGGGAMWLLYRATDQQMLLLDGRERAPEQAYWRMLVADGVHPGLLEQPEGPRSAAIPGLPAGLVYLAERYGRLPLRRSLRPAIDHARRGFETSPQYRRFSMESEAMLARYPDSARIYLREDRAPAIGSRIVQKDLARSLQLLAERGMAGFYQGQLAEQLVQELRTSGGIWTLKDLADYRPVLRQPLISTYGELRIVTAPPPSAGGVVLSQALKILEHFELAGISSVERNHLVIESLRRAFREPVVYLGDPDFTSIPVNRLLDSDYIDGLALTIEPDRATPSIEIGDTPGMNADSMQTTHFSVIDREGNRVSGTLGLNRLFGSGYVVPGTGILLNNSMENFSAPPSGNAQDPQELDHANVLEPGKRPLTTMTPVFLETADRIAILGSPGGNRIISSLLLAVLDFAERMPVETWVAMPRFHHQYLPDIVSFEMPAFSQEELNQLRRLGHRLEGTSQLFGDMQAILWDRRLGVVSAASDPRGEGTARVFER